MSSQIDNIGKLEWTFTKVHFCDILPCGSLSKIRKTGVLSGFPWVSVLCFVTQLFSFVYSSIIVAPEERGKKSQLQRIMEHINIYWIYRCYSSKEISYVISSQFTEWHFTFLSYLFLEVELKSVQLTAKLSTLSILSALLMMWLLTMNLCQAVDSR